MDQGPRMEHMVKLAGLAGEALLLLQSLVGDKDDTVNDLGQHVVDLRPRIRALLLKANIQG
jgi:hypothetical protein